MEPELAEVPLTNALSSILIPIQVEITTNFLWWRHAKPHNTPSHPPEDTNK